MPDLRRQFKHSLQGRVCFMGLGSPDYGDDGFGVRLAEALIAVGMPNVIIAGTTPDRWIGRAAGFDHIVFLDAVEFGEEPGSVVFLDSAQMAARFPQISTHKISLALLAQWAEANGTTKVWVLGVQPESLKPAPQLTPTLQRALETLCDLLETCTAHVGTDAQACPERSRRVRPAEHQLGSEFKVHA
jgi:hydrogenase maturation protease